jgi:hypothetical protein
MNKETFENLVKQNLIHASFNKEYRGCIYYNIENKKQYVKIPILTVRRDNAWYKEEKEFEKYMINENNNITIKEEESIN